MTTKQFASLSRLSSKDESEKAVLVAFYCHKIEGKESFTPAELVGEMVKFGLSKPNISRLKDKLTASRTFVKAGKESIKISLQKLESLESSYPAVGLPSEEVVSDDTILPQDLYLKTRGYIEKIAKQINGCYQHNLFDGCAMLMRRLVEVLIILTYRHIGKEGEVKDSNGNFHGLSYLINHSLSNRILNLTKDSEQVLDDFRQLGNYSAHGLEYNCRKGDIDKVKFQFRACVEELLYRCSIKK